MLYKYFRFSYNSKRKCRRRPLDCDVLFFSIADHLQVPAFVDGKYNSMLCKKFSQALSRSCYLVELPIGNRWCYCEQKPENTACVMATFEVPDSAARILQADGGQQTQRPQPNVSSPHRKGPGILKKLTNGVGQLAPCSRLASTLIIIKRLHRLRQLTKAKI